MIGTTSPETVRVVRVQDTMRLRRVQVSEALLAEARDRDDLAVVSEPEPIRFDDGQFVQSVFDGE